MSDTIAFKRLDIDAVLPTRGSVHAAGLDLYAAQDAVLPAHGFATVHTGLAVAIPDGFYGRIAPRSGLAAKHGIDTLAGVIDSDYRGELLCVLSNHGTADFVITAGDRIAQFVIESIIYPSPVWVEDLPVSERGASGFGSTGA